MRVGHTYIKSINPSLFRGTLDSSVDDFDESLLVRERLEKINTSADLILITYDWVHDFHRVLAHFLVKERKVLSIGSCFGENESPFIQQGFDIICSDINPDVVSKMKSIFGADRYMMVDIFNPSNELFENNLQDMFISGLDYAFDDKQVAELFSNCAQILKKSKSPGEKRLLFTLRYNDNFATQFIDFIVLPFESFLRNNFMKIKRSPVRFLRKAHGFRRSRNEIVKFAEQHGFELRRTTYGGYGVELSRSAIFARLSFFKKILIKVDTYLNIFNNITLFEFVIQ